jgi:hypothetical protein
MKFIYVLLLLLCCFGCSEDARGETYDADTETETSIEDMEMDEGTDRDTVFEEMDMDADTGNSTDEDADTGMGTETGTVIDDTGTETITQDTSGDCRELEPFEHVTIKSNSCIYIPVQSDYNGKDLAIHFSSSTYNSKLVLVWGTCGPNGTTIINTYLNLLNSGGKSIMTFDEYSSDCDIVLEFVGDGNYISIDYRILPL